MRIAVLVSGGGTNLQALIDAGAAGQLGGGELVRVISSKPGVYALERAAQAGIPAAVVARADFKLAGPDSPPLEAFRLHQSAASTRANGDGFDRAMLAALADCGAELVVLAGFLSILGPAVTAAYENRIINVHPALIPSFCGRGFYGLRVHEAALAAGVKITGATVHLVNEIPDGGAILLQKAVPVLPDDTPETLQRRVMEQAEWALLPQAVAAYCEGRIRLEDGRAYIDER